jgi:hypothetical protein
MRCLEGGFREVFETIGVWFLEGNERGGPGVVGLAEGEWMVLQRLQPI